MEGTILDDTYANKKKDTRKESSAALDSHRSGIQVQGDLKHGRFVSFKTDADANLFSVNIENYSEIDWFDFEMRMRKLVHTLMEPSLKQSTEDRANINKLQRLLEDHDRRVNDIEIVLFKKDEEERMGLFDSIYKKITDNEKQRLMEEEKLRDEIAYIKNEVHQSTYAQENLNRAQKNQQEQTMFLNQEFQDFNERIRKWQEDFLHKYSSQHNGLLSEISEIREKNINLENDFFKKEQEIRRLQSQMISNLKQFEQQDIWLNKIQDQANDIEKRKCDTSDFIKDLKRIEQELEKTKLDVENHGNHFAMVENFVEKYIPIRIQSTISEVLSFILPYKEKAKLSEFEKKRFQELHQIILEDDGIPKLAEQLKQIRMKMEDKPYQSRKKLMAVIRRGDYVQNSRSSKNYDSEFSHADDRSMKSGQSNNIKRINTLSSSSLHNNTMDKNSTKKGSQKKKSSENVSSSKRKKSVHKLQSFKQGEKQNEDRDRERSQQQQQQYKQKEVGDYMFSIQRDRSQSDVPRTRSPLKTIKRVKDQNTIKEVDSGKQSQDEGDHISRSDFQIKRMEEQESKNNSSYGSEDEDDSQEGFHYNSKMQKQINELQLLPQKIKYQIDDLKQILEQQIDIEKQRNESKLKEIENYILNLHSEIQQLNEIKKKEKSEFSYELTALLKKFEEIQQYNLNVDKTLIHFATMMSCLVENNNLQIHAESQKAKQQSMFRHSIIDKSETSKSKRFNALKFSNMKSKISIKQNYDTSNPYSHQKELKNQDINSYRSTESRERSGSTIRQQSNTHLAIPLQTFGGNSQQLHMPPIHSNHSSDTIQNVFQPFIMTKNKDNNETQMTTEGDDNTNEITVKYKNYELDQQQIRAIHKVLLTKCHDIIKASHVFQVNNLTSKRVFQDCINYINLVSNKEQMANSQLNIATNNYQISEKNEVQTESDSTFTAPLGNPYLLQNISQNSIFPNMENRSRSNTSKQLKYNLTSEKTPQSQTQPFYGNNLKANVMNIKINNHFS